MARSEGLREGDDDPPGETACLRCMSRGAVPQEKFPVIGVAPGIIGMIQATEVIKYLVELENC